MTTPTPPERYADLADLVGDDDPAMARLVSHLDRTLRDRPAPPQVYVTLELLLRERIAAAPAAPSEHAAFHSRTPQPSGLLSRRDALRAGAAGIAALLTLSHITPALADELARLAQDQPMTGTRLASILQAERTQWNALLAQVGLDRMEEPGVEGEWSVKELVAHLTWYEQAIVEGARQFLSTGTFTRRRPADMGLDELNAHIAAESRARPTSGVLAEADEVFGQLLRVIAACPEDLLNDPRRLGLPEDMVPWMGVANNSYAHYRQHEPALRAWLDRTNPRRPAGADRSTPEGEKA
jgi:DinB superfamily